MKWVRGSVYIWAHKLNNLVHNVPLKWIHILFGLNKSVKKKNPRIDSHNSGINDSSKIEQTLVVRSLWFS